MQTRRRTNLLWGVVVLVAAVIVLLRTLAVLPDGLNDVLGRSWPVLLVLAGLSVLLPGRVPMGRLAALVLSLVLVGVVTSLAYSTRADQQRDDQVQAIDQAISAEVSLLAVNVNVATTDIELLSGAQAGRITGTFTGSLESAISIDYTEGAGVAEFTLRETKPDGIPPLEAVGRGYLRLELPPGLAVAVAAAGDEGAATFNMSDLELERLTLELGEGDALVTLPAYQPLSPTAAEQPGRLTTNNGNVTVFVPENVAARLELNRGGNNIRPQFDPDYILIDDGADGTLEKRAVGPDDITLLYEVTAPRGLIRLEVSGRGGFDD